MSLNTSVSDRANLPTLWCITSVVMAIDGKCIKILEFVKDVAAQ